MRRLPLLCTAAVLCAGALPAQTRQSAPMPDVVTGPIVPAAAAEQDIAPAHPPAARDDTPVAAPLIGNVPVYLEEARTRRFRYSLAASSGYDSAVDDLPHRAGGIVLVDGYAGVLLRRRHFDMFLQHDAQFTRSFRTGLGLEQYQRTALVLAGRTSRRTDWSALLENGYGTDAARAAGSLTAATLQPVVVPDQDVVAYGLTDGNVLTEHAEAAVAHRLSERDRFELDAGAYAHHFFANTQTDEQYRLDAELRRQFTSRAAFGLFGNAVQENDAALHCTNAAAGVSGLGQLTRNVRLEGSFGPDVGTANCHGTYQYTVSLASETARGSLFYIGSARVRSDGLVQTAAWEQSAFAGFALGQPRDLQFRADAGYAKFLVAAPTATNPDLHGAFIATELHHRLNAHAELVMTARYFSRGPGEARLNRSIFLLTYTWSSEQRGAALRHSAAPQEQP